MEGLDERFKALKESQDARATLALLLLARSSALLRAPLRCVSPPTHAPRMAIPDEVAEVAPLRCVSPPTRAAPRMAIPDEVAEAMAAGALQRSGADVAIATTGSAGPDPLLQDEHLAAPVGRVYVAYAARSTPGGRPASASVRCDLAGSRPEIQAQSADAALTLLHDLLTA